MYCFCSFGIEFGLTASTAGEVLYTHSFRYVNIDFSKVGFADSPAHCIFIRWCKAQVREILFKSAKLPLGYGVCAVFNRYSLDIII